MWAVGGAHCLCSYIHWLHTAGSGAAVIECHNCEDGTLMVLVTLPAVPRVQLIQMIAAYEDAVTHKIHYCERESSTSNWTCTRKKGHEGMHIAGRLLEPEILEIFK